MITNKNTLNIILFIAGSFLISGCATIKSPITGKTYFKGMETEEYWKEVRQDYINKHPSLPPKIKSAILGEKIILGMTKEQVLASWGDPAETHKYVYPNTIMEQWTYEKCNTRTLSYSCTEYLLIFINGVLASYSD